jgi:hypothetical protein
MQNHAQMRRFLGGLYPQKSPQHSRNGNLEETEKARAATDFYIEVEFIEPAARNAAGSMFAEIYLAAASSCTGMPKALATPTP